MRRHIRGSEAALESVDDELAKFTDPRCWCGAAGQWRPVLLLVPSRDYMGDPIRVQVGMLVCGQHRDARAERYLTDDGWRMLVEAVTGAGKAAPHRPSTRIDYELVETKPAILPS